jgi:hypothetical protein
MGFAAQKPVRPRAAPPAPRREQGQDRSHYARRLLRLTPHSLEEANRFGRSADRADRSHCATGLLPFAPHSLVDAAGFGPTAAVARMAHYHLHVKPGPKGSGAEHAQYIERGGRFKTERYGEIGEHERGNLPDWAKGSAARFFAVADEHERANGNAYREFELALPVELSDLERGQLVREFVAEQIGDRHAYAWAIHEPQGHNPHVHVMFSERLRDGIERGPEQYFKRANAKNPERGGHAKSDRFTNSQGPEAVQALRARWADLQNRALERAGVEARVDHRSLEAQGIDRDAMQHRGPAVSGIEKRRKESEVSMRREAERAERAQAREPERRAVEAEVRVVTRQQMAAEKVAARERRELAAEVTGPERELVLPLVEADRREQIGRAQGAAERRVERRQSLGGRLGKKLLSQARVLRDRIGQQIGRVKEWVRERFPEQIKERARDLFGTAPERSPAAAKEAAPIDLAALKAKGRAMSEGWRQTLHTAQAEERRAESVRQEQQRLRQVEAERVQRERQALADAQAREQAERQRTVEQFRQLAVKREAKGVGYTDRSEDWRATPQALRERIDRFNALAPEARKVVLERLVQEPARRRGLDELQQLMGQRRELVRALGRGMGR